MIHRTTTKAPSPGGGIDAVTLSVIWGALRGIPEEMGAVLARTAHSEAVREGQDLSTGLFDVQARMVSQGTYTPGHLGAMPYAVQHALDAYPENLVDGDGIILNDPYLGAGHFPDIYLISPVYWQGEVVGYAVNVAHHVDVGGPAPGSQLVPNVDNFYQEGIRILPVKAVEGGRLVDAVARVILANVRVPETVLGDLLAQVNANAIGCARLQELLDRYGRDLVFRAYDEIINRCEQAMRKEILNIPDGTYTFEDFFDDYGPGTQAIRVFVTVKVDEDEISFDWEGSSPQVPAAMNSYINYTRAYCYFAIQCLTDPKIPQNHGCLVPIHVRAPDGSFFNPRRPAAGGGRAITHHRIFESIMGALAPILPDRAIAASSDFQNLVFGGVDGRTGREFVYYDVLMGGQGGRAAKDGLDGICSVANASNIPVEACEIKYPILIERYEYVCDTAGAGEYRGGCAVRRDIRVLEDNILFVNLSERTKLPPFGIMGGKAGAVGQTILNPESHTQPIDAKGTCLLRAGDVVSATSAGSGGYGDPLNRDPRRVERDVVRGILSPDSARDAYGVVLYEDNRVNINATEALRAGRAEGHS